MQPDVILAGHRSFEAMYVGLEQGRVSRARIAAVLQRMLIAAPGHPSQAELSEGAMLMRPRRIANDSVSRAVSALQSAGLVSRSGLKQYAMGRPHITLQLGGSTWASAGAWIEHSGSQTSVHAGIYSLSGERLGGASRQDITFPPSGDTPRRLAERIAVAVREAIGASGGRPRLLGLGVGISGHIVNETVLADSWIEGLPRSIDIGQLTTEELARTTSPECWPQGSPAVIVDNDVNLFAVKRIYEYRRFAGDSAIVAVFDQGIGSALIINGRVHRGAWGMAGEIAHYSMPARLTEIIAARAPLSAQTPTFSSSCKCGASQHIECAATPARLIAELAYDGEFDALWNRRAASIEESAFEIAGEAVGVGIVNLMNTIDPSDVEIFLPGDLPPTVNDGSNGNAYARSIREYVASYGHLDSAERTQINIQGLSASARIAYGVEAAALRVADGLIQHGKGRCRCYSLPARATG